MASHGKRQTMTNKRLGVTQQKILLLLFGGLALGMCRRPDKQWRIVRGMIAGWKEIDGRNLQRSVDTLYRSKLVKRKGHRDGSSTLILTNEGRRRALHYTLYALTIPKPKKWDGKWRVVMYDIPEEHRALRHELHHTLCALGFIELQHSVFAHPYECRDQIDFLIESYDVRPFVRYLLVEKIDIDEPLKRAFVKETREANHSLRTKR